MKIKLNDIYTYLRSNDPNYVKYCKIKDNPYYLSLKSDDEEIYNNYVNTLPSSHRNRPTGTLKGLKDLIKKIKHEGFRYGDRSIVIVKKHNKYFCKRGRHRLCVLLFLYDKDTYIEIKHRTIIKIYDK